MPVSEWERGTHYPATTLGALLHFSLFLLFRERRLLSFSRGDACPIVLKIVAARSAGRIILRIMASMCAK
jgi:hypothetical protein